MKLVANSNTGSPTGWTLDNAAGICPEESAVMTCVGVKETQGVERQKYANPNETEKVDMIRFCFARKKEEKQYFAQTREFRQSASSKSALMAFLTSWLGKAPAVDGSFETDDLIGKGATVTISHTTSPRGTKYAQISGIGPVLSDLLDKVLPDSDFTIPGGDPDYKKPAEDSSVPY